MVIEPLFGAALWFFVKLQGYNLVNEVTICEKMMTFAQCLIKERWFNLIKERWFNK